MEPTVAAAFITALGAVAVAWVPTRATRRTRRELRAEITDRVGTPNGKGTVIEMLEQVLAQQHAHAHLDDRRFRALAQATGVDPAILPGDEP